MAAPTFLKKIFNVVSTAAPFSGVRKGSAVSTTIVLRKVDAAKVTRLFVIVACFLFVLLKGLETYNVSAQTSQVRVALLKNVDEFTMSVRGRYRVTNPLNNDVIFEGRVLRKSPVRAAKNGIQIAATFYPFKHLKIILQNDVTILINNKEQRYREAIDIFSVENQKLLLVNAIDLEQYIKGVLYHEVSHRWPLEAIKAQAVAVRTYALYQMNENRSKPFDVTSDVYSQVYGGRNAERYRTNIAANRTKGEVLVYQNKILPAYYSSNCAGHTEDAKELWDQDLSPLKGVVCPFCRGTPNSFWRKNFRAKDVQDKLMDYGYKFGLIKEIKVKERDPSGRVKTLKISDRQGNAAKISGKLFREILGPNTVKSSMYDIVMKGYYFDIYGRGWGHGVGMCQWGAYGMSLQRYNYKEILSFYYPGSELVKY